MALDRPAIVDLLTRLGSELEELAAEATSPSKPPTT